MIKKVSIVALTLVMLLGGSGMALAAASDDTIAQGQRYLSVQEPDHDAILELKLERIENMYQDGRISKEQADNYSKAITERMQNCEEDCTCEGRPAEVERLNVGFGFNRSETKGDGNARHQGLGSRSQNGGGLRLVECI